MDRSPQMYEGGGERASYMYTMHEGLGILRLLSQLPTALLAALLLLPQEVVEAINEFAFVASDYPVILSIENHCKRSDRLLRLMANIFTLTFGEKLLKVPFDDFPVSGEVDDTHMSSFPSGYIHHV